MRLHSRSVCSWTLIGGALAAFVLLTACGGGDSSEAPAPQAPVATTAASGPGTITIKSTAIRGQSGRALVVFVMRDAGGPMARACVRIESDSFTVAATKLTDAPAGGDPCSGQTAATTFSEGRYTLSAGIFVPPAQAPEKQVTLTVEVKGNVDVVIDGASLSR